MADQLDFKAMAFMHDAPRFWHTRNIAVLASQDEAVKSDYIQGLVAFAIFILSFFVFWALSLAFFKLRGIKRYGCIAGQVVYKRNNKDLVWYLHSLIHLVVICLQKSVKQSHGNLQL